MANAKSNKKVAVVESYSNNLVATTNAPVGVQVSNPVQFTAPANAMSAMANSIMAQVNAPISKTVKTVKKDNSEATAQAVASGLLDRLASCTNTSLFWEKQVKQLLKPYPTSMLKGFKLRSLTQGPRGGANKCDRELSVLAIELADSNGYVSSETARLAGLCPHNLKAWNDRAWITLL